MTSSNFLSSIAFSCLLFLSHNSAIPKIPTQEMSCSGCRVLRKGCSESCMLRPCLNWIETAEAQAHAIVFVARFFGRAALISFISAVPENQRPALFRSLLYEACGRTVNPVHGVVGLLRTGNWHVCQTAVETVLRGGTLHPLANLPDPVAGHGFGCRSGSISGFNGAEKLQPSDLDLSLKPSSRILAKSITASPPLMESEGSAGAIRII